MRVTTWDFSMLALALLLVFAALVYAFTAGQRQSPTLAAAPVSTEPRFDWVKVFDETIDLSPGQGWSIDTGEQQKVRAKVSAEGSVNINFGSCVRDTVRAEFECSANGDSNFLVTDTRTSEGRAIDIAAAIFTKSSKAAERATAPNRVTLALYSFACIENCVTEPSKPKRATPHQ